MWETVEGERGEEREISKIVISIRVISLELRKLSEEEEKKVKT